jgi:glucose-1-phosphate thymidylyltransferase
MLRAVIPAAGEGRRLKPHTHTTPKVLLQVAGKPIIGHIMDRLLNVNPDEVIVIVGNQGTQIQDYLTKSYSLKFHFVEQKDPKGLGDAVGLAAGFFANDTQPSQVLILLGDTIVDINLKEILGKENYIGTKTVDDPRRFGVVETKNGYVIKIVEKPVEPKSNLAIIGLYYFSQARPLFENIEKIIREDRKTRGEYQLSDALEEMVESGIKIKTYPVEYWLDCGTPDALIATNRYLLQTTHYYKPRERVVIIPPVCIDDSVSIEESVIGPFVSIGEGAEIRNSIIRDSIINQRAYVENCLLESSILSESAIIRARSHHVNLGAFSELELG